MMPPIRMRRLISPPFNFMKDFYSPITDTTKNRLDHGFVLKTLCFSDLQFQTMINSKKAVCIKAMVCALGTNSGRIPPTRMYSQQKTKAVPRDWRRKEARMKGTIP